MKYPKPSIHSNTSKLVIRTLYRVKRELGIWNIREVARRLNVNPKYVYYNIIGGFEPTDKTEKGQETRKRLGLKPKKPIAKVKTDKPKVIKPDYIVTWEHLPKEERHKVIKQYLEWRNKNGHNN